MPISTENPYTIKLSADEALLMHDVIEGTITAIDRDNKTVDVTLDEPYYPRDYETNYGKLEKYKKYEHLDIEPITEISGAKIIYNCRDENEDPSNAFHVGDNVLIVAVNEEYFCVGFPDEIRECAFYDILVVDIGTEWIPDPGTTLGVTIKYNKAFFLVRPDYEIEFLYNEIITQHLDNVLNTDFEFSIGNIQLSEQIDDDYLDVVIIYNSAGQRGECITGRMDSFEIIIRDGDSVPAAYYPIDTTLADWLLEDGVLTFKDDNGLYRYSHTEGDMKCILTGTTGKYVCTDAKTYIDGCPTREYTENTITNEWICTEDTDAQSSGSGTNADPYIAESTTQYQGYYLFRTNDACISVYPYSITDYSYEYKDDDKTIDRRHITMAFDGCTDYDQYYSRNQASSCNYQIEETDATISGGDYTCTRSFSGITFGPNVDRVFCQALLATTVYYRFLGHYGDCNMLHQTDFQPQYPLKATIKSEWDGSCYEHYDSNAGEWTYSSELNITRYIYLEGQEIPELTTTFTYSGNTADTYKCSQFSDMATEQYFMLSLAEVKHKIAAFYSDQTGYKFLLFHNGLYTDITSDIINSIEAGDHAEINGAPGILRVRWQRGYDNDSASRY